MIKYCLLCFALAFAVNAVAWAQPKKKTNSPVALITGTWRTDHLIGDERENEFFFCAPEIMPCPKPYTVPIQGNVIPGKTIVFNADGTFKSEYTDGEEKLLRMTGTYEFIGNQYVRFKVLDSFVKGIEKPRVKIEQDTSLFFIQKDGNTYRLFRSEGNLQADKQNVAYSNIISPIRCDAPSPTDEKSPLIWYDVDNRDRDSAIVCCLSAYDIENYKFVYQQRTGWLRIYMIEVQGEYRFVVHHPFRKKVTLDSRKVQKP